MAAMGSTPPPERTIDAVTATFLVVASMIGSGVFITTGNLLASIPSPSGVLLCWAIGGLAALCGALSFAELSVALSDNGGGYQYLSKLYHPALGFVSAWTSLIVGFAAPMAAVAAVFGLYLHRLAPVPPLVSAVAVIVLLSGLNVWRMSASARVQNALTIGKVLLVFGLGALGLLRGDTARLSEAAQPLGQVVIAPGFAAGLLVVSFAYTGWDASSYVAGEVKDPARTLPRALIVGTLLVTGLYVLLNAAFLAAAPADAMRGNLEVARIAAVSLLGARGGGLIAAVIAIGLVSTVGAMVVTGPRVYEAVGRDYPRLGWLATRRAGGGPLAATLLQAAIALALLRADVDGLLEYIGFTLSITAGLAVAGVFVLRRRKTPLAFRMPGYPIAPALFVALMAWMTVRGLWERPQAGLWGLGTVAAGLVVWRIVR